MARKKIKKIDRKKIKIPKPPRARKIRIIKKKSSWISILYIFIFVIVLSSLITGILFLGISFIKEKGGLLGANILGDYDNESDDFEIEFVTKQPLSDSIRAVTYLPAVDKDNNGIMTLLVVEAIPGSGRTLVDVDNLLFWADTQHSIRIAKKVAANISGIDTNKYDIVYNIYANASVIGGESAGAAITIATISVLKNKSLRDDVVITGTINHDGTIGPVQSILPKAKASKKVNAEIFLVPLLQGQEVIYETREHCEKFGFSEFCKTESIPRNVNISKEAGLIIREVGSIEDALEYFFEE